MEARQERTKTVPMFAVQGRCQLYVQNVLEMYFVKGLNSTEISNRTGTSIADVVHVVMKFKEYRERYKV
ncbi:MAG: hypothetical protein V1887_03880 [Candidatus Aenigmatarchaeota archaeon]